jgi:hypothetical protein
LAHLIVMGLAVGDRARAFKGLSPGMLPPLGIIFGLLVGFIAAQVWSDFEKAKVAVANEASALRTVNLLAANLPAEPRGQIRPLVTQHIDNGMAGNGDAARDSLRAADRADRGNADRARRITR